MTAEIANCIHGERVAAPDGQSSEPIDPSSGDVFATAPVSRETDIDAAFQDPACAFESWSKATTGERRRALLRIADAIEERVDELVESRPRTRASRKSSPRRRRCLRCATRSASSPASRACSRTSPPAST